MTLPLLFLASGWDYQLHRSLINVCFGNVAERRRQGCTLSLRQERRQETTLERETGHRTASTVKTDLPLDSCALLSSVTTITVDAQPV